jgi:hypothetical protein
MPVGGTSPSGGAAPSRLLVFLAVALVLVAAALVLFLAFAGKGGQGVEHPAPWRLDPYDANW